MSPFHDSNNQGKVRAELAELAASCVNCTTVAKDSGLGETTLLEMVWTSPLALFLVQKGRYLFCNPQGAALLGYTSVTDVIGKDAFPTLAPEFHETVRKRLKDVPIGKSNPTLRMDLLWPDGSRLPVETNSTGILFNGERASLVTGRDISEQVLVETRLAKANQEKELILDSTNQRLAYYKTDMTLIWANKAYRQGVGLDEETIKGRACFTVWHDRTSPCPGCPLQKTLETGSPQEAFVENPNGQVWYLRGYPVRNDQGELIGLLEIGENRTEQIRIETKLEQSQERLKIALEGTHDGLWDWPDLTQDSFWWSPRFYEMLGYRPYEFVPNNERFFGMMHPDDREEQARGVETILRTKDAFESEYRLFARNGEIRWFQAKGQVFCDTSGKPIRMAGSIRDITDRKVAESALRESETKFRRFAENSQDVIYIFRVKPTPQWVYVSPSVFPLSGYQPEDFYQDPDLGLKIIGEDALPMVQARLASDMEASRPIRLQCRHKHGGLVWTEHRLSVVRDDRGDVMLMQGIARNIAEQVRSEEEIRRLNEVLNLQNKVATIFLTKGESETFADVLDVILETTQSSFGLFGYIDENGDLVCPSMTRHIWSKCQMPDKSIVFPKEIWGGLWGESLKKKQTIWKNDSLSLPFGHVQLENALAVAVVHMEKLVGQIMIANRKGGYSALDADRLERIADQVAPILHAQLEKRRAEAEQRALKFQLIHAQKMEAVGRLAGGIAHDFNNILTGITGNVSMMMLDISPSDPFYAPLREVDKAGERAAALVRQLLAFSRKQLIEPRVIDLNDLLLNIEKMLGRIIGENITLSLELEESLPSVKVDPGQLEQVIVNLAVNARDAMSKGGTLLLRTAIQSVDPEEAATLGLPAGGYVILEVRDTGTGMDATVLDHLFEPFFTTKPPDRGTGLGLATSFGVIQQHRGTITAESKPLQGSAFRVFLPSVREKPTRMEKESTSLDMSPGKETILLVEDETIVRDIAAKILMRLGYTVLSAGSAEEASYLFQKRAEDIDLLLTDVMLPDLDGRQLAEQLLGTRPALKILYTSGYSKNILAVQGELPEGLFFLAKPYTPQGLAQKVRDVLDA